MGRHSRFRAAPTNQSGLARLKRELADKAPGKAIKGVCGQCGAQALFFRSRLDANRHYGIADTKSHGSYVACQNPDSSLIHLIPRNSDVQPL